MAKGRQGRLLSYLALAMVIVGALVHGLPMSASPLHTWQQGAVIDVAGAGDHGVLPGPLQPRDLREQRSIRASLDNGADSDTLTSAIAGVIEPTGRFSFFLFDSERRGGSTPRLAHRPRDPPRLS